MKQDIQRLEHIPGLSTVDAYLKKQTHLAALDLSQLEQEKPSLETSLNAEDFLMLDLEQAKVQGASTMNDLRNYIRAVSWMMHGQLNEEMPLPDLSMIRTSLALADDPAADKKIMEAIKQYACGDEIEPAVLSIEDLMSAAWEHERSVSNEGEKKAQAISVIQSLRPIRDQLYYQREYPNLCRIAAGK